jgi:hypothetical protein
MMNNVSPPRITATAGTKLVGTSFLDFCHFLTLTKELYGKDLLHSRGIAGSNFRLLSKIPHCCLKKAGPFLSPSVADRPLSPAKDRRLDLCLTNPMS